MSEPFVMLRGSELKKLLALPKRELAVLLSTRYLTRNGWTTRRRDIGELSGYNTRHVQLALAALEAAGWIRREWPGNPKDKWGRFRVLEREPRAIPGIAHPKPRAIPGIADHLLVPDRIHNRPSKTAGIARAAGAGREGGLPVGHEPDPLLDLARKLWPELAAKPARKYLAALRELADGASEDELARYLKRAAKDPTLQSARLPLAVASSPDRVRAWRRRASRRPHPAPPKSGPTPVLSRHELAELAAAALRHF